MLRKGFLAFVENIPQPGTIADKVDDETLQIPGAPAQHLSYGVGKRPIQRGRPDLLMSLISSGSPNSTFVGVFTVAPVAAR